MRGSPVNSALQASQTPITGVFLTRFTIRRLRFGMNSVSHRMSWIDTPLEKLGDTLFEHENSVFNAVRLRFPF